MNTQQAIHRLRAPISMGSLVTRAWKTDPNYQYELGKVIEVKDNKGQHPTHGDVRVQWQRGFETNELYQELYHIEIRDKDSEV